jgi:exopolysaccharide production protein ExoQ
VTAITLQPVSTYPALAQHRRSWPWFTTFLILVGFFFGAQDPYASQKWQENAQGDVKTLVQDEETGRPERQAGLLLLGAVGFVLLIRRTENPWRPNPVVLFPLVMLVLWSVMSAAWSPDPAISFKRVVALMCGVVLAVGLVRQFEMERLTEMAVVHCVAVAVIGIIVELILWRPYGPNDEYRFAGTVHPNHAGAYAALLILSSMYLGRLKSDKRFIFLAIFAAVILFLTKSRTALAAVIVGAAIFISLGWTARKKFALLLVGISIVVAITALDMVGTFSHLEETVLLDRQNADPTTLTGRTTIWAFAFDRIKDDSTRMLTGFGYGGFWTKDTVAALDARAHFKLSEGHNAYLDLLLQVGSVGLFLYLWGLFAGGISMFRRARRNRSLAAAFGVAVIGFAFTHHIAESGLLDPTFPSLMLWTTLALAAFRPPTDTRPALMRKGGIA